MSRERSSYAAQQQDYPAIKAVAITPHDSNAISPTRAIYVGGDGDISVTTTAGDSVVFYSASAGTILPISVALVKATGTTATNLLGLY